MGDDLMGSSSAMPEWSKIKDKSTNYARRLSYISGNNKILEYSFNCVIKKSERQELIRIWDLDFAVTKFEETCSNNELEIKNTYYLDEKKIVRRSSQFHSQALGNVLIERLDR